MNQNRDLYVEKRDLIIIITLETCRSPNQNVQVKYWHSLGVWTFGGGGGSQSGGGGGTEVTKQGSVRREET